MELNHLLFLHLDMSHALRTRVKQESYKMESMQVFSKVEKPTPWCAGIVVVPKKSGTMCITVDLKRMEMYSKRYTLFQQSMTPWLS